MRCWIRLVFLMVCLLVILIVIGMAIGVFFSSICGFIFILPFLLIAILLASDKEISPHDWGAEHYEMASDCTQFQECSRCGKKKILTPSHLWERRYISEGSCMTQLYCMRCNAPGGDRDPEHQWLSRYQSDGECTWIENCQRCGQVQTSIKHAWEAWSIDHEGHTRSCLNCGLSQTGWHRFDTITEQVNGNMQVWTTTYRKCADCGYCTDFETY